MVSTGEYDQMSLGDDDDSDDTPVYESWCVTQSRKQKYRFSWTIEDFPRHADSLSMGQVLKSCVFSAEEDNDMLWRLHLYPRGNVEASKDHISLFLVLFSSGQPEISTTIRLSLLGRGNIPLHTVTTKKAYTFSHMSPTLCTWGHPTFIPLTAILERQDDYLPDDMLTIVCEGSIMSPDISTSGSNGLKFPVGQILAGSSGSALGGTVNVQGVSELAGDLGAILKSSELCDVTLVVEDQKYKLHRSILAARSPYLMSLLKSEPEEIEIKDVEPIVMDGILYYIYTGQNPCLCSEKNMDKYLVAANKLELARLKANCEQGLCQQIDNNNLEAMAELAEKCSAMILKVAVQNFQRKVSQDMS